MPPAPHTPIPKPLQELERLPLPERHTFITLGNSILAESVALQAPPAQAFRQSLAEQLSEMKGIHALCWLLGGLFLTAGLVFYTGGAAALPVITDWSVAVLLGLTTLGLSAAELRIQRNMRTYQRIDALHTRYGHSLFCDMLHTARHRFHLHQGKPLADLLINHPAHLSPAARFAGISRTLMDEATAQAALEGLTPSAFFQKTAKRHARTVRLTTVTTALFFGTLGYGVMQQATPEGYAAGATLWAAGARALYTGRRLRFLFTHAAQVERQHGPTALMSFVHHIETQKLRAAPPSA